ncbi:hypothetical protein [Embleya sp. NPDC050493]|uniref:hypothetical protein n=1 Tax=Embleya sp. NPDC050493 TaxID=3363989 RepID=UPI0037969934
MSAGPNPGTSTTTDPTTGAPRTEPTSAAPTPSPARAARPGTGPSDARSDLAVLATLQSATQFADTKVGILGAVQAGILATAIPRADAIRDAWERGGAFGWFAVVLLAAQVSGFVAGIYCVAQALRPRLNPPAAPNRFSLPLLAAGDGAPPTGVDRCEQQEIWQFARVVAEVAMTKHRHVTRAIVCTGMMAVTGGSWFLVGPLLG